MTSILSNTSFNLYSTNDAANQNIQQEAFGVKTSAAIDTIFSAKTLTPVVKEHIDALKSRAECNEHSSIELLQNIALRNDAVGKHAEKCLFEVYSGAGAHNGAAITIEQSAQSLIEIKEKLDTKKTDIPTNKLASPSALLVMASGELGKGMPPVLKQQVADCSVNDNEKNAACQQLNLAFRTRYSENEITDNLINTFSQEAKTPGRPIEARLVQNALQGACLNSERCSVTAMYNAQHQQQHILPEHQQDLQQQVKDLSQGNELAIPVILDDNHFGIIIVKKSNDNTYAMSAFDPLYQANSSTKQKYDSVMDTLGIDGTRTYLMEGEQDMNDCGVHCAQFLEHYTQGSLDIQDAYNNYTAIVSASREDDVSADNEGAEVDTSSQRFRNNFMILCTKGLMSEYIDAPYQQAQPESEPNLALRGPSPIQVESPFDSKGKGQMWV